MTVSDCIAQLTRLMKQMGSGTEIKLCCDYNSRERVFDAFYIQKPADENRIYFVPNDVFLKSDLKGLAAREANA